MATPIKKKRTRLGGRMAGETKAKARTTKHAFASRGPNTRKMINTECGVKIVKGVECTRPKKHTGKHYATHPSARGERKLRAGIR